MESVHAGPLVHLQVLTVSEVGGGYQARVFRGHVSHLYPAAAYYDQGLSAALKGLSAALKGLSAALRFTQRLSNHD